jgi:hypothetical protein
MTTSAPHETERQLAARTREAWRAYSESLRSVDAPDYDHAEDAAWERLQAALQAIEADRGS